jgi:hypothetical protein
MQWVEDATGDEYMEDLFGPRTTRTRQAGTRVDRSPQ